MLVRCGTSWHAAILRLPCDRRCATIPTQSKNCARRRRRPRTRDGRRRKPARWPPSPVPAQMITHARRTPMHTCAHALSASRSTHTATATHSHVVARTFTIALHCVTTCVCSMPAFRNSIMNLCNAMGQQGQRPGPPTRAAGPQRRS